MQPSFFCGSPDHALNRRGFLGAGAAVGTTLAADMTALDVLAAPGSARRSRRRRSASSCSGWPAARASWRPGTPSRAHRPAARSGRSRPTVPGHPDLRADAEDGAADGAHLHHPLAEHQERRPRRRRPADDARPPRRSRACAIPTWARSSPASWGRPHSQVPDYVSFYSPTEGRGMAPGDARLPRRALRPDGADHEHDPGEPPPPRRASPSSTTSSAPSSATC